MVLLARWMDLVSSENPVELSLASAEKSMLLAQAPHYKQSAVVAWLLEEEHRLLSAAAGFDRLADVVLNVACHAIAAGCQAVAVALQAADGLLDCLEVRHGSPC
jgi:hypothetical protein